MTALPTAFWLVASPETTTAPSMPMNTHRVTIITSATWPARPSAVPPGAAGAEPKKPPEKTAGSKWAAHTATKTATGTNLATVPTMLSTDACSTPRRARAKTDHTTTEAPRRAGTVLPAPKAGTNGERVAMSSTP